jgi:uncharacterized protein YebE (UPF0316 family)
MIIKGILHNRKAVKDFYQNFRKLHAKMFIGATLRVDDFNLTEGIMAYTVTAVITMVVKSPTDKFLMRYEETIGRTKVEVTNDFTQRDLPKSKEREVLEKIVDEIFGNSYQIFWDCEFMEVE